MTKDIWRSDVSWGGEIYTGDLKIWKIWRDDLQKVSRVVIPRCYFVTSYSEYFDLHTFVDAEEEIAAAVGYVVL